MTNQTLRGTGRTTRMLLSAIDYVQRTKEPAYIYVATSGFVRNTQQYLQQLAPHIRSEFLIVESLKQEVYYGYFDLQTMQVAGAKHNATVFIDHYALELMLEKQLKELHRYDNPIVSQ